MAGKTTNAFYGNKHIQKNMDGYFCKVECDQIATGEHITELRRKRHLSREQLVSELFEAGLLRVSVTTMGKWERGEVKNLELGQVEALCRFFGCSHDELVVYREHESVAEHDPLVFLFCPHITFENGIPVSASQNSVPDNRKRTVSASRDPVLDNRKRTG